MQLLTPVRVWEFQAHDFTAQLVHVLDYPFGLTLLAHSFRLHQARELAEFYGLRWRTKMWFRDIKASMGMETHAPI